MPFKSKSQQRFFNSKGAKKAGIDDETVDEFNSASKGKKLPEKAGKGKSKSKKRPVKFGKPY